MISVQTECFDVSAEHARLAATPQSGAVVTFCGLVRDFNRSEGVSALTLEHYPGMTEKCLQEIEAQARERWPVNDCTLIHRVGRLEANEPIVFVGVSSAHRKAAFEACEFMMDYLKTRAPFWKKEQSDSGEHWVEAKDSDQQAAERWQQGE
ncbi:molybdopterin synthase catalytic subunit MoaE [Dongshaea marina]|uniref:molybdopterin synthase catalytic subunit MoaE n=1 Tax=Dongshaea marina TaxID=2047966 RepID=UPI000D3E2048|nr:molybdopterin synthase catalytic subunit MoaE [Dongshaea marina]